MSRPFRRRLLAAALGAVVALAACEDTTSAPSITVGGNPALSASVDVDYDSYGVPHVHASSDDDAAYALGYVHARDRMFQMDFLRRAARGRLAEMLGPQAVPQDVTIRTLFTAQSAAPGGSRRIEDVIAATLSPALRTFLQRYADGVNRYLQDLQQGANGVLMPVEYIGIQGQDPAHPYAISPWAIEDTLAIGRILTFQLSGSLSEEINFGQIAQAAVAACGATPPAQCPAYGLFTDLTRYAPAANAFPLPPVTAQRLAKPAAAPVLPGNAAEALARASELAARLGLPTGVDRAGSNNWVVGPSRTASGHPLVANDPHLSLSSPPNFQIAQVTTPTREVAGVAFPGTPVIQIGHNGRIGWGATVAGYDVTDVYWFPAGAGGLPVTPPDVTPIQVPETIQVRGAAPVNQVVLLLPKYGPVVGTAGGLVLSARWTGQEASNELEAFYDLNAARSVDEAFAALAKFQVGAQNFVVGDVDGNIGYDPHAHVPIRKAGCFGQRVVGGQPQLVVPWAPMPGFDGSCEWTGRIPDAELPQARNPAAGFVATANTDILGLTADGNPLPAPGAAYPHYLYPTRDLGYREARVQARLTEKSGGYTLDDMTSIQADVTSLFAADLVPALLAWYADPAVAADVSAKGLGPAVGVLQAWADAGNPQRYRTPTGLSGRAPTSAPASDPAVREAASASMLFHALVPRLARRILDDELAGISVGGSPLSVNRLGGLLDGQQVAKYLAALAGTARGSPPAVPLATATALCDDVTTTGTVETCAQQAVAALEDAVAFLTQATVFGSANPADWLWGRKHRIYLSSTLAAVGVHDLDVGPYANDGGLYTVDVANFSLSNDGPDGFVQSSGANVRFSVDLTPGNVRWRAVIPGGEAGYQTDPHFNDQTPLWLDNAPGDQPWGRSAAESAARRKLVLEK
jgi:penicillin amidase